MNSLILDCSKGMSVYVLKDEEVFSFIDENEKKHTDELLVCVDNLLREASLKIEDIDNVCVCIGPGSFTGIRVAVSICKGLVITKNIKICVASNFDVYSCFEKEESFYILDGFSDNIYLRKIYGNSFNDSCVKIEEFVDMCKSLTYDAKIYVQSEKMQNILNSYGISSEIAKNNIISCFKEKIDKQEFVLVNEINPIYLRASQAEIERMKKLNGEVNG